MKNGDFHSYVSLLEGSCHGSFQTRLTACDDQKSRMMYVMLKSKGGDRIGCAMGGGVAGFNWSHIVTSIIGYCISSWTHSDKSSD